MTPLLPKNSVLIIEVSMVEREYYIHSWCLLPRICVLSRGMSFLESVLEERDHCCIDVNHTCTYILKL